MFKKENTIERLTKENAKLELRKQQLEDEKNRKNSEITTKVSALETKIKSLNDEALRNNEECAVEKLEIDRLIKKNRGQMELEAKFYAELTGIKKDGK